MAKKRAMPRKHGGMLDGVDTTNATAAGKSSTGLKKSTTTFDSDRVIDAAAPPTRIDNVFDEYDKNSEMTVMSTHDPIRHGLNAIAHYFSTGVIFMYLLIYMASTGLMYIWIVAFESTSFLREIQVESVTMAFQALALLVPLIINRFNADAENTFAAAVLAYGRSMEWCSEYTVQLGVLGRVQLQNAEVSEERNRFIVRQIQYVKLLHYLIFVTYISGRIDILFQESRADLKVLAKHVRDDLRRLRVSNRAAFFRGIIGYMHIELLQALHDDMINEQEYNMLNAILGNFRAQASSMAAGQLPVKNKILKNHQYLVVAVYLFVVVPVSIHNIVQRYAIVFYGPLITLLVSNMTIPYWLGSIMDSNQRFADIEFVNKRDRVYDFIQRVETNAIRRLDQYEV